MAKREFSAGGVVCRKRGRALEVLLIKDSYGRWTWPKGKIDPKESSQDAALREITEEAGLKNIRILKRLGRNNYFFRFQGDLIFKTVYLFLLEATGDEKLKAQRSEIEEARWFKPEQALETVAYKGARQTLEKAIKIFKAETKCSD